MKDLFKEPGPQHLWGHSRAQISAQILGYPLKEMLFNFGRCPMHFNNVGCMKATEAPRTHLRASQNICGRDKRPLPSFKNPHFQNDARCTTFLVKMSFICMRMRNDFHIKGWAPTLVLKQRPGGTLKWPISITEVLNDGFLLDTLKTLFRLSKVRLDL